MPLTIEWNPPEVEISTEHGAVCHAYKDDMAADPLLYHYQILRGTDIWDIAAYVEFDIRDLVEYRDNIYPLTVLEEALISGSLLELTGVTKSEIYVEGEADADHS